MKKLSPYMLLLPAFVFFAVFSVSPIFMVFRLSTLKTNFLTTEYVGMANFAKILHNEIFWKSVKNTLVYAAFIIPGQAGVALFVALTAVNMSKRAQDYVRFAFYAPVFASPIIMTSVWRWIFHPVDGLVNYLLSFLGVRKIIWFGERLPAIGAISFMICCSTMGSYVIIYLATMLSVSTDLYDAAQVDGATWPQIKLRIILPMIFPTVSLISLLSLVAALQIWVLVHALTNGGPNNGTSTIMYNIYLDGFNYSRFGMAAAKSLVLFLIVVMLSVLKKRVEVAAKL